MGCLNSEGQFKHYFANIHLSGKCNRSCYFCIGQHMMALDPLDNLDTWPLSGIDEFIKECNDRGIGEVNLTGTNTDPLLYKHLPELKSYLQENLKSTLVFGIRTNGVLIEYRSELWSLFDKGSISITSFDPKIYKKTMGQGKPPDLKMIKSICDHGIGPSWNNIKFNIVLCPELFEILENHEAPDLFNTIYDLWQLGAKRINIREPYGQPNLGDKFKDFMKSFGAKPIDSVLGMPRWTIGTNFNGFSTEIAYWDIHFVEVESVNLYANGIVSTTYPITKGHDPENGKVEGQEHFSKSGRVRPQWLTINGA